MADVTLTTFDAMMKEIYDDSKVLNVAIEKKPLLQWLPKGDDMLGDNWVIALTYASGAGRAGTFTNAQTNAAGGKHIKWNLTRSSDYAVVTFDAEVLRASRSNKGAFVSARKREIDGHLDLMGRSAAKALYGQGYGILGRRASASTDVITLENADDCYNFYVGMVVEATTTTVAAAMRAGDTFIESIQYATGTITLDSAAGITSFADNDYLIQSGDADTATKNKLTGLLGWLPLTAPTAGDSFFGVDRSTDPIRLAGNRLDATSNSIEENILTLAERVGRIGGSPDTVFLGHTNFNTLAKSLGSKVEYQDAGGTAKVGFSGFKMYSSAGELTVVADPFCPDNRGYMLQKNTWKLLHMDPFPHIVKDDGLMAIRQTSADGIEVRLRYWAQLACYAPGFNGVFSI